MNKKQRYRILSSFSVVIILLSIIISSVGQFMYYNLGKLGTDLPIRSVDQFRNIANIMPLVSELSSDIEAIQRDNRSMDRGKLGFTISKLKATQELIDSDFDRQPPYDLLIILQEITLLTSDLSRSMESISPMSSTSAVLLKNRIAYVYSELRDYVLRINNATLSVLERQRQELRRLKLIILLSPIVSLSTAALTFILLQNQKKTLSQLEASKALAVANSNAKSEFLSNMSHEIRTPMNAIIGLSYLALKTNLTPSQRDYLKRIQISGQHLLGIINDILDFSKIEADMMTLESIPFELEKVLDNVANLTAEKAGGKGLELVFEVDKSVPNHLVGDPLRLGQVLINYANNAVKFTDKGEIGIRIKLKSESEKSVHLYFEVTDTGVGITDEHKAQLFNSFQQARIAGARILLVEDNDLNQDVATELLKSAGCPVDLARNGVEAIRMVQSTTYDIVLMDVQMPVMDGLAATREIRKIERFAALPIIAMTANAMREDKERCLAAGMNAYITKPIDPDAMFASIQLFYTGAAAPAACLESPPEEPRGDDIPSIAGVNTRAGLKRVVGNGALYLELLRRYSKGQREAPTLIRTALDVGDVALAERIAHTLKGVSGNIGADDVQAIANELEASINGNRPPEAKAEILARLSSTLASTLDRVDAALTAIANAVADSKPSASKDNGDGSKKSSEYDVGRPLASLIDPLSRFAKESDSETLEYFSSVRGELVARCGEDSVARIETSIQAYDFSAVVEALDLLSKNIGKSS